ncbi:MAG TPA: hypothetical protein VFI31_24760 [Pirellulales bacterium]|nr:hypothetical protein [Pirellulales bacterium]
MAEQSVVMLSSAAAAMVRKVLAENQLPRNGLLRVKCVGEDGVFTYELNFTGAPESDDVVCRSQGVRICFDRTMAPLLQGTTIDFHDGGGGARGFTFMNPNASEGTQASDPARVALSLEKLAQLSPEPPWWRRQLASLMGKRSDRELRVQRLTRHLLLGDSRAAVVISLKPLLVAAYSEDIDCVALLRFPDSFADRDHLAKGSRLLTVNVYSRTAAHDLAPGPGATGDWGDFMPVIAEFLSDDVARIEARKREIPEAEWRRATELAELALHDDRIGIRPGSPL